MPRLGRATIYMGGLTAMFFVLVTIGGLGWTSSTNKKAQLAIGILLVVSTLINMITIGPVCYPIVAETPSGKLRYKTVVIGRFVYNLTGIFSNSVTPRMLSPTCKYSLANIVMTVLILLQLGTGEPKPLSSMREQICSATSGVGSVFRRRKTAASVRLICSLTTTFPRGSSSIPRSTVSPLSGSHQHTDLSLTLNCRIR